MRTSVLASLADVEPSFSLRDPFIGFFLPRSSPSDMDVPLPVSSLPKGPRLVVADDDDDDDDDVDSNDGIDDDNDKVGPRVVLLLCITSILSKHAWLVSPSFPLPLILKESIALNIPMLVPANVADQPGNVVVFREVFKLVFKLVFKVGLRLVLMVLSGL